MVSAQEKEAQKMQEMKRLMEEQKRKKAEAAAAAKKEKENAIPEPAANFVAPMAQPV